MLTHYSIDTHLTHQQKTAFENIMGKGDIAHYKQFLLFPQCFLPNQIIVSPFVHFFDIISLFAPELEEPKICISGKGLKGEQTHIVEKHGNYSKDNNLLFYRWSKC